MPVVESRAVRLMPVSHAVGNAALEGEFDLERAQRLGTRSPERRCRGRVRLRLCFWEHTEDLPGEVQRAEVGRLLDAHDLWDGISRDNPCHLQV